MKKFLDSQMLMAFSCERKESSYCTGLTCPPFARTEDSDGENGGSAGSSPLLLTCLASVGAPAPHLPPHTHPVQYQWEMLWNSPGFACTALDTEEAARSFKAKPQEMVQS